MNRFPKEMQVKSRSHEVTPLSEDEYLVVSGASGELYTVKFTEAANVTCTCEWGKYREPGTPCGCSHVVAVRDFLAEKAEGRRLSVWSSIEDAHRQHKRIHELGDGLILTSRIKV